jgi:hypothetical protein
MKGREYYAYFECLFANIYNSSEEFDLCELDILYTYGIINGFHIIMFERLKTDYIKRL